MVLNLYPMLEMEGGAAMNFGREETIMLGGVVSARRHAYYAAW